MNRTIPLKFNLRHSDKVQKLRDDLEELFLLIQDAHCAYEIWWILVSKDGRKQYFNTFLSFKEFFVPVAIANSTAMSIGLFKLYDKRVDTLNFMKIIENAETLGIIDSSKNKKFKRKLSEVVKIWKKICILRNNILAHRNYFLTRKEVYKLAKITPNQIERMIDLSVRIFNTIWMKIDRNPKKLNEFTHMDTIKMLELLQERRSKTVSGLIWKQGQDPRKG